MLFYAVKVMFWPKLKKKKVQCVALLCAVRLTFSCTDEENVFFSVLFLLRRCGLFSECYGRDLPKVRGRGAVAGYAELSLVKPVRLALAFGRYSSKCAEQNNWGTLMNEFCLWFAEC